MADTHAAATAHLPFFFTAPGETDVLLVLMTMLLVGAVLAVGVLFFWLHSLPERMVHNRIQYDLVAVLALLALFTHIHAFWVAALLLALIKFPEVSLPDFLRPLNRIAGSLETIAETPSASPAGAVPSAVAAGAPAVSPPSAGHGASPSVTDAAVASPVSEATPQAAKRSAHKGAPKTTAKV